MANDKISQLPLATSPLDSAVEMPVVQSGVTKRAGMTSIGFLQSGTSAVLRTAQDKMRETISVEDFGAVGNGVADDKAAIQAAIDACFAAGGGSVFLPTGTYRVVGALVLKPYVSLIGENQRSTVIQQATASAITINCDISPSINSYGSVENLSIVYSSQGTAGGTAINLGNCFYVDVVNVYVYRAYIGYAGGTSSNSCLVERSSFEDCTHIGMWVFDSENISANWTYVLNSNTTLCALGCFRLENLAQGCNFSNCYTFQGAYPLISTASVYADGVRPAFNKFEASYFDAAPNPAIVEKTIETDFDNCWFSNGRGNLKSGVELSQTDGIRFTGGQAINSGAYGALVNANCTRTVFNGFAARDNSVDAANTYDGIAFAANTTDFTVTNCILTNDVITSFGTQRYGINVAAGTSDRYIITGNLLTGNGTGGINDGGSGTTKYISYNTGYRTSNSGSATVPSTQTSIVVDPGLSPTFTVNDVLATAQGDTLERWWVEAVSSTTFKIQLASAAAANRTFSWSVRTKGA
jgi:hypothetical protein